MRRSLVSVAVVFSALLIAVPFSNATMPPGDLVSMTVNGSPHAAGAHHVRVAISIRYRMQCGYPGAGPLVVTFPSAMKLPRRFATGSVKLDGRVIAAKIKGRQVTVAIAPHTGVLCGVIGLGSLNLTFTHAAKIANPAHAGSYGFVATHARHRFRARLVVAPA